MTVLPPDGSRDRRIEDPTNLWLIHPAARALLPYALRAGVSANAVSFAGLAVGIAAAVCYAHWQNRWAVLLGLVLSAAWLVFDGLDGMVARATATASPFGRFLDGMVDHGVFILIYVTLAGTIGTAEGWALAIIAGAAHVIQSMFYEGERARFHRRARGVADLSGVAPTTGVNRLVRGYDRLATWPDRLAAPFERMLAHRGDPQVVGQAYARAAVPVMRLQSLLSANVRVWMIALACLLGNPRLFWWAEIVPLSLIALLGLRLHRRLERGFVSTTQPIRGGEPFSAVLPTRDY
jgi:phosphatidylglycerophosphate synthase